MEKKRQKIMRKTRPSSSIKRPNNTGGIKMELTRILKINDAIKEQAIQREHRLIAMLNSLTSNEQLMAAWRSVAEAEVDQQQPPQNSDSLRAAILTACNVPFREEEKETAPALIGANMVLMSGVGNMQGMGGMPGMPGGMVTGMSMMAPMGAMGTNQDAFAAQVMPQAFQQQQAGGLGMTGVCMCEVYVSFCAWMCVCV